LIVVDQDPEAIAAAMAVQKQDPRLEVEHTTFSRINELAQDRAINGRVDGILFDLGVSSPQLDNADRGFSFLRDGPLDMRMNPDVGASAARWINSASEKEIADVFFRFGEERYSRRMARRIVSERMTAAISTTGRLAEIVKQANPAWEKDKHPATRAFQAIRIYINNELEEIEKGLAQALDSLNIGGRLVVISFHSLEDRIVKKFIALQTKGDSYPRDLPVSQDMLNPRLKSMGKAMRADSHEIEHNPRARSAIMRVAEKIA
jgi:16S rRNA (cytosine1402-N4)-methyltransferase